MSAQEMPTMITSRKRDRGEIDVEEYSNTKRVIHDGFQSLSLSENGWPQQISPTLSDELFRRDSIESASNIGLNNNLAASLAIVDEGRPLSRNNSVESDGGDSTDSEPPMNRNQHNDEFFQRMFKGGRNQYVRKVDYLVDELLRQKTHRTGYGNRYEEGCIPSSIGPHPTTDLAISSLIPYLIPTTINMPSSSSPSSSSGRGVGLRSGGMQERTDNSAMSGNIRGSSSGGGDEERYWKSHETTHSDWEIEELYPSNNTTTNHTTNDNNHSNGNGSSDHDVDSTTMSCCDDDNDDEMMMQSVHSSPPPSLFPILPSASTFCHNNSEVEEEVEDVGAF